MHARPGYVMGSFRNENNKDEPYAYERYHPRVREVFLEKSSEFIYNLSGADRDSLLSAKARKESMLNNDDEFLRCHYGYTQWPALKDKLLAELFRGR